MTGRFWTGCCGSRPVPESLCCCAVILLKEWFCPFVLRAVTPFAEPEKSLNAMDGLTIIVSDLVKQPCDSDYKYNNIISLINQLNNII